MAVIPRREPRNLFYRERFAAQTTDFDGSAIDCTGGGRLVISLAYDVATTGTLDINLEWNPLRDGSGTWTKSQTAPAAFLFVNNYNDGLQDQVAVDPNLQVTADGVHFFSTPVMGPLARLEFIVTTGTWTVDVNYMVLQGT